MTIPAFFGLLALLAVIGAGGLLLWKKPAHHILSFLGYGIALAGLYLLLGLPLVAAIQLIGIVLSNVLLLAINVSNEPTKADHRSWLWAAPVGLILLGLLSGLIVSGRLGEPVLTSIPMWAARQEPIVAFGQELLTNYLVLLELWGLLLLVGIVAVTYLLRE